MAGGRDTRPEVMAVVGEAPRGASERKRDTMTRLEQDVDAWVASAGQDGDPYLVPLSFIWDGATLTVATPESSSTGRNLRQSGRVRMALGLTRDVVLIEGTVEVFTLETAPPELADAFAAKLWDVRLEQTRYAFFRITPQQIQAWREVNELAGRTVMRAGQWLV